VVSVLMGFDPFGLKERFVDVFGERKGRIG